MKNYTINERLSERERKTDCLTFSVTQMSTDVIIDSGEFN